MRFSCISNTIRAAPMMASFGMTVRVLAFILPLLLTSCTTKSDPTLESLLGSMKDNVQQTTLLQSALQSFYQGQSRWPTNAADFWAAPEKHWPDQTQFKRLEFTPKGDGSTFVEYELALEYARSGCFNLKPDEKH